MVRTRPSDRKKIVIRDDQILEIEEQWSIINGTHEEFLASRREYDEMRQTLRQRFKREPSESDIEWGILNNQALVHIRNCQWGLYRNGRLAMGDLLTKERKLTEGLSYYLEVCYLDLNGPNNTSPDPYVQEINPSFEPQRGDLAPGVIGYILSIKEEMVLSPAQIELVFIEMAKKRCSGLGLPLSPQKAWPRLRSELAKS